MEETPVSIDDTFTYHEKWHGECHFSIDQQGPSDVIESKQSKNTESKKPTFSLSSLKEKLGGTIDKKKLEKNQQICKKRNVPDDEVNDQEMNSIYENKVFDITSNFTKEQTEKTKCSKKYSPKFVCKFQPNAATKFYPRFGEKLLPRLKIKVLKK